MGLQVCLSGALFATGWYFFIDGVAKASQERFSHNSATFLTWTPGLLSTVAFFLINLTHASMFASQGRAASVGNSTAAATLVLGWALAFGASILALSLCASSFVSPSDKDFSALGTGMVFQTLFIALSAVCQWSSGVRSRDTY